MKNIFLMALLFAAASTQAQKVVEKTISFGGKEAINLDLHISDSIGISTWSKNEVYVKAVININNNQFNDDYKIRFDESGNSVNVIAKFETDRKMNWNKDSNCCSYRSDITWQVFIPENARFSVETINGNITIVGKTEEVKAYTISGYIDLAIPTSKKADFKLSTITGTIYSDVVSAPANANLKSHSANIATTLNGGGKPISLKTISGDIYLRKQ